MKILFTIYIFIKLTTYLHVYLIMTNNLNIKVEYIKHFEQDV